MPAKCVLLSLHLYLCFYICVPIYVFAVMVTHNEISNAKCQWLSQSLIVPLYLYLYLSLSLSLCLCLHLCVRACDRSRL